MKRHQREESMRIIAELKHELEVLKASTVGWTKVDYTHGYKDRYHAIDIAIWCEESCGDWKKMGTTFFFKDEKDASMFIMKWL